MREHLLLLLARKEFDASDRNRRFLTYVVDETLAGRGDRIKAYNIALAAFDRAPDFDPATDPIVRIEAGRLRRSLEHYYLTAGRADRIRIDVPKGSYIPTFAYVENGDAQPQIRAPHVVHISPAAATELPTHASAKRRHPWQALGSLIVLAIVAGWALFQFWPREGATVPRAAGTQAPSILVVPFDYVGADATHAFVARGLTYEIIAQLTRLNELFVFGPETSFKVGSKNDTATGPSSLRADYILMGSVHATDATVNVSVILSDARTEQSLWSWTAERDLTGASLINIESDIASHVAGTVAQPYGIVFDRTANEIAAKPAKSLLSYECVVWARQIWRSDKYQDFESVRECLEAAIAADPGYAKAHSRLALLYVDAYRFGLGKATIGFDPLQRALELAKRAVELDPNSGDSYLSLFIAQWFSKDVDKSIETARQGLALNPHNTDLLGELGFRYAMLGKWDLGMPLIAEAYARNPRGPTSYRVATSLNAYMHGDYRKALDEALLIDRPTVIYTHMVRAIAYARLGEHDEAAGEVQEILAIDPHYGDHVGDDLAKRNTDPSIIAAIIDGLGKAGLKGTPSMQ